MEAQDEPGACGDTEDTHTGARPQHGAKPRCSICSPQSAPQREDLGRNQRVKPKSKRSHLLKFGTETPLPCSVSPPCARQRLGCFCH